MSQIAKQCKPCLMASLIRGQIGLLLLDKDPFKQGLTWLLSINADLLGGYLT